MSEINTWTSLETVSDAIKSCTKCPLSRTRKNTVPGAGCSNPTILFVGEGPGFNEDGCCGDDTLDECGVCGVVGPTVECVDDEGNITFWCSELECNEHLLDASESLPIVFKLSQNYPNPFNPVTTINFDVASNGYVSLKIYDILGNHINDLVSDYYLRGRYTINWTGVNKFGQEVASGVYIYQLQHSKGVMTKKMVLIR